MAEGPSTKMWEIAKCHYPYKRPQAVPNPVLNDGEVPKEEVFIPTTIELLGSPESWILLDCQNRLVNRYRPAEVDKAFDAMAKDSVRTPLYVGIDAFTLHPVFMFDYGKRKHCDPDSAFLKAVPGHGETSNPIRVLVTAHQYFFNEMELGEECIGSKVQRYTVHRDAATAASVEQIQSFKIGDVIEPYQHEKLPDIPSGCWKFYFEKDVSDYTLELPRLTKATITPKLFELANDFQRLLSSDNIHLNEIIMAMFVWSRHESSPTRLVEDMFLRDDGSYDDLDTSSPIRVSHQRLIDFVAMWPHYLRFHEIHKLGTHIHPLRFVKALKEHDTYLDPTRNSYFREKKYPELEEMAMREVALSGLDPCNDWCEVLPSTLKGSRLRRLG